MVRAIPDVLAASRVTTTNVPGMCQKTVRNWFGVGSAGDVDGDGDADAVDGWLSEPKGSRHTDRHPPIGAPVAWSGGSGGFGHRALVIGGGADPLVRSTDAAGRGKVGNRRLSWFEKNWGLKYLGWSETISGVPIKGLDIPKSSERAPAPKTRGGVIDRVLKDLDTAKLGDGERKKQIQAAKAALKKVPYIN